MKKLIISILLVFVFVSSAYSANRIEAWVMAQDFVEAALKSPSTAKFSTLPWHLQGGKCIDFKDGSFYIQAYVDSQNSYGAMIRTWFSIIVTNVGGSKWKASDLHWLNK